MKLLHAAVLGLAVLALGGCASFMAEPYQTPEMKLPGDWVGKVEPGGAPPWPDVAWWQRFGDPELDQLIAEAIESNQDLKAAAARVAQARAQARIARAGLYPTVVVPATAGVSDRLGNRSEDFYSIALQASYEVDVWGKNRFTAESGDQFVLSSAYGQEVVRIALVADVATNYFLVLSLRDRIRTAEQSLESARRVLDLLEAQYRGGKITALDVERQYTVVAGTEAILPPLRQQLRATLDALAVLLGRAPQDMQIERESLRPLPLPVAVPGLPADLIGRRPDVRRAEADLIGANADIGAARAAMYPSLVLSAQGGYQSSTLANLFRSSTGFYSIAADALATIFDGGRLAGQRDFTLARKEELVESYRRAVLAAFQEVEDALSGVEHFQAQEALLQQAAVHAREAYRLAEMRYFYGATDFLTVLDAQRAYIAAEQAVDPARFSWASSVVALYRALGGGWEDAIKGPASTAAN